MRTWLRPLYRDLHSIPASQYSVDPGMWDQVIECLDDQLQFRRSLSAIPKQGKLIQVRHQKVESLQDVRRCYISDRRIWLPIRDPNSSRRRLSPSSQRSLDFYDQWLSRIPPLVSLRPKTEEILGRIMCCRRFCSWHQCWHGGVVSVLVDIDHGLASL